MTEPSTSARTAGLPVDTSATAIGYSADGLPWIIRHLRPDDGPGFWVAVGFEADVGQAFPMRATMLRDECAGFIVEHDVVAVRA
jgi:hypothetical protein